MARKRMTGLPGQPALSAGAVVVAGGGDGEAVYGEAELAELLAIIRRARLAGWPSPAVDALAESAGDVRSGPDTGVSQVSR